MVKKSEIKKIVRENYGSIAREAASCGCAPAAESSC
jgi:hypothetical protein